MANKIRVLIADDHAILRQGLRQILSETRDLVVAGEASDGDEALREALRLDWDVCVLDISMPNRNGIDTLRQFKREYPRKPVLVLSMHPEEQYAVRAIQSGAAGYLSKQGAATELVDAIRKVAGGGKYISATVANKLAEAVASGGNQPDVENLSDRELEVLKLMAGGKTVSQIAEILKISNPTVSTYRARLLEKLGLENTAELIRFGLENCLLK